MFNTTRMYYGWTQVSTDLTECSGGSRGEAWRARRPPPLFLEQTEAGRAEKKILETGQNGRPKLFFCLYLVKRLIVTLRCAVNVTTSSFQHFP